MTEYNDEIQQQLESYIENPAVLVTKDDIPYEYKSAGSVNRLKKRRYNEDVPLQLYAFVVLNGITKNQLKEFASGLFLNYVETSRIYM